MLYFLKISLGRFFSPPIVVIMIKSSNPATKEQAETQQKV